MSFTTAAFKVHRVIQNIIPTIYSVDVKRLTIKPSKRFDQIRQGAFGKYIFVSMFLCMLYYSGRLIWGMKYYDDATPLLELAGCSIITAFHLIYLALWYTEVTHFKGLCFIASQSAFVKDWRPKYPRNIMGFLSTPEAFVYSFAQRQLYYHLVYCYAPQLSPLFYFNLCLALHGPLKYARWFLSQVSLHFCAFASSFILSCHWLI